MNLLFVALGGAIGSVLRYLLGALVSRHAPNDFPYATLAVNALGCFVIGLLVPAFIPHSPAATSGHMHAKLLLVTGLLGGFTTFSAFGLETYSLYRGGHPTLAALNIVASIALTLAAVALGMRIGRIWT